MQANQNDQFTQSINFQIQTDGSYRRAQKVQRFKITDFWLQTEEEFCNKSK